MASPIDRLPLPYFARAALVVAGSALLLTACTTDQQATDARPAVRAGDDENGALMRVAALTRKSGDFDTAIALYRRAHDVAPRDPQPLIELAGMLDERGASADAAMLWQDALRLAPDNVDALGGYGLTLARLGQAELARTYLQRATAVAPMAATWNALGVVRDQLGDAAGAQQAYRAGLALAPTDLRLANNLGLSLALSGRYEEALPLLERAAVRPDATARNRQNLALAYALAGKDDLATKFGSVDSDPAEARRSAMRYASIAALPDHASRVAAVSALERPSAARNQAAASVEAAALVRSRQQAEAAPQPTGNESERVTPVVVATRLAPAGPKPLRSDPDPAERAVAAASVKPAAQNAHAVAEEKRPPAASPMPSRSAATTERAATPAPSASDDRADERTTQAASVADPGRVIADDSGEVGPVVENAGPVAALATPALEAPQVYRPAFVAATESAPAHATVTTEPQVYSPPFVAPVAAPADKFAATAPQVFDPPFVAAPVTASPDFQAAAVADTPAAEGPTAAVVDTPDAEIQTAAVADTPDLEVRSATDTGSPDADAAAPPSVAQLAMNAVAHEPEPAVKDADATADLSKNTAPAAPADEPAALPLALTGIVVPSVDDRLIVAVSAYQAGEYAFAASIWEPLADAGVVRAQFHLGALYYEGRGVERDLTKAYMLLRKAELAGFGDSRIVLSLVEAKLSEVERRSAEAQVAAARP